MKTNTKLIDRLCGRGGKPWSDTTALEVGEMVHVGTLPDAAPPPRPGVFRQPIGLRLSRAVFEDCRGAVMVIRDLAAAAAADGAGRPPRRVRILAPIRGKHGSTRAAVVELVAVARGGWVEVREEGEG
ncbi:hypothetical protein [Metallibacterium sp.]|uniref:hypothetical protein n=1 Tax=Metallibacterium sp. TaxID=2940281 RepID=UPI002612BDFD|nr:hypothetical protein [Metallibacterium sp.]